VPISYRFDKGFLFATLDGPTGYEDVRRFWDTLFADPQFRPGMPSVIDCRPVQSLFSIGDLRRMADESKKRPELQVPGRAAVLASSNLVYGLLRMYEVFTEGDPVQIRVFRKADEAMLWLTGPGA